MPSPVECPTCGEPLAVPADLRGSPVRCAACNSVFTPPADDPHVPVARPVADDTRPRYADEDERPARRPRKQSSGRWVWVTLGLLGLLSCGCCGLFGWFAAMLVNPKYKPYIDPAGRFTVGMPNDPRISVRSTGRKTESAAAVESSRPLVQETFFVYHLDLTNADKKKGAESVIAELCDGLAFTSGGKEVFRRSGLHDGQPSTDIAIDLKEQNRHTIARVIVANGRAYVVGVTGPGQPDGSPWVEEYLDGFKLTGEAAEEKPAEAKPVNEKPAEVKPAKGRAVAPMPRAGQDAENQP